MFGQKKKEITVFCLCIFCPSVYPWKEKSQVVGLTVGTLLVLLQTWLPWYRKIAFHWGHQVSHVSADRALARVKGHSAMTNCAVQCNAPSLHAVLRVPPSSWQPFPDHVLLGCAWSPWSPPPVERVDSQRVSKAQVSDYFTTWTNLWDLKCLFLI